MNKKQKCPKCPNEVGTFAQYANDELVCLSCAFKDKCDKDPKYKEEIFKKCNGCINHE